MTRKRISFWGNSAARLQRHYALADATGHDPLNVRNKISHPKDFMALTQQDVATSIQATVPPARFFSSSRHISACAHHDNLQSFVNRTWNIGAILIGARTNEDVPP